MSVRGWALLGVALGVLGVAGWWYRPLSPRLPPPAKVVAPAPAQADTSGRASAVAGAASIANPHCPPPPRVGENAAPLQSPVPSTFPALGLETATLVPLAGFSIDARVLSRRDYAHGREAEYSPTDLALGWGRMREAAVLSRLEIEQRGRWYHYRWSEGSPPIPSREIAKSSANMHLIPADQAAAAALRRIRAGQRVRIDGWLVQVEAADGWRWRSSLSRDDQGAGACEVIYACTILAE